MNFQEPIATEKGSFRLKNIASESFFSELELKPGELH